jgi:DNA-binding transcriptional ArsR family regulator
MRPRHPCKDTVAKISLLGYIGRVGVTEATKRVTDVRTLRAVAHPLRTRLLALLRLNGPATATELARRTGESSGATSYHLRQLGRYGFVEEDGPRVGRQRRWRASHRVTSWEPADFVGDRAALEVSDAIERRQLQRAVAQFESWMANRSQADPRWLRVAGLADDVLRLTPAQARSLTDEMLQLWRRYREAPPPAPSNERPALVAVQHQLLPFERLEELDF